MGRYGAEMGQAARSTRSWLTTPEPCGSPRSPSRSGWSRACRRRWARPPRTTWSMPWPQSWRSCSGSRASPSHCFSSSGVARYVAWTYWFAVVMVGTFGTMAADVLHVGLGVSYTVTTIFYAVVLIGVFALWRRTERTLSIHSIDTPRREAFYWATVVATFAMGTALGDFTAYTFHLGYFPSAVIFAGIIVVADGRLPMASVERDRLLLVRLCDHSTARGLDRRRSGEA